jgi:hypothetical protein
MKLKIGLKKVFDRGIAYTVLEQDESLRSQGAIIPFLATNGMEILSSGRPEIATNAMFLRGCLRGDSFDKSISLKVFESTEKRDRVFERILEAFAEFAANGYFKGKKEAAPAENEDGIYEF